MRITLHTFFLIFIFAATYQSISAQDITTHVFHDLNGNGIDNGEPGLTGLTVTLFQDMGAMNGLPDPGEELGVMTDAGGGDYEFIGAPLATDLIITYSRVGTGLTNPLATLPFVGAPTDNNMDSDVVEAPAGTTALRTTVFQLVNTPLEEFVDAGLVSGVTISDNVFVDNNGNGLDDGEPTLDGVTVDLLDGTGGAVTDATGNPVTAQVTAGGFYEFINLLPGDYQVTFDVTTVPGAIPYYLTTPSGLLTDGNNSDANRDVGFQTGTTPIFTTVSGNDILYVDAGAYQSVSIGDFTFEDVDGDGLSNGADDLPLDGVQVELLTQANVLIATDITGAALTNPVISGGGGLYEFLDVAPGDYKVRFTMLTAAPNGNNYFLTVEDVQGVGPAGDDDSDAIRLANPSQGEVDLGVVASGSTAEETRVDAGFYAPVTIGDFVWNDLDGNGLQDDVPFAGPVDDFNVEISDVGGAAVNDANGNPLGPLTAAGGNYQFLLVPPGDYIVTFVEPTGGTFDYNFSPIDVSGGVDDATDLGDDSDADATTGDTHIITVQSGETDEETRIDAGVIACVTIGGDFWTDANGNGIQDGGAEGPVDGVTLRLMDNNTSAAAIDCAGGTIPDQVTGSSGPNGPGSYQFTDVPPGDYYVEVVALANATDVMTILDATGAAGPDGDTDSDFDPLLNPQLTAVFTVVSGDQDEETRVDGGVVSPVEIGDMVWHDENGNGIQDGGEPGLDGIDVTIARTDGNPLLGIDGLAYPTPTLVTAGGGMYLFQNLPSGEYTLTFSSVAGQPDFYLTTPDYSGAIGAGDATDDSDAIDSGGNQTGTVDVITVVDAANPLGSETVRVDAGFYDPVSIGDMCWHDRDLDGTQNEADPVPGITVTLRDAGGAQVNDALGNPLNAVTDGGGMYSLDLVPPGTGYTLEFSGVGTDWYLTRMDNVSGPGLEGADDSDAVFVAGTWQAGTTAPFDIWSENTSNWVDNSLQADAGFYDPASVGNMVFHDLNGNGFNDGEPDPTDLVQIEIDAIGPSALGAPQPTEDAEGNALPLTANGGMYNFDLLMPGEYEVTFTPLAGAVPPYRFTEQDVNGLATEADDEDNDSDADEITGVSHAIMIESREDVEGAPNETMRIDAGVFRCVKIGGDFWTDANGNGIQDGGPDEGPVDGAVVRLIDNMTGMVPDDCDGVPMADQTTGTGPNGAGSYEFEKVPPGEYVIEVVSLPMADMSMTLQDAGGDTVDSDFPQGPPGGTTAPFTVDSESTDEETRNDGGVFQPASIEIFVWHDANGDGEQQIGSGDECGEDPLDMDEAAFTLLLGGAPANDADGNPIVWMNMGGGLYRAENLAPGVGYQLQAAPAGPWQVTLPHFDGTVADIGDGDVDSDFAGGVSPTFELLAGPTKENIDLGMWQFLNVGGFVFLSNDCTNCVYSPPDHSVAPDVVVNIYADLDGDGVFTDLVGSATTDMDGNYAFMMLPPGDYRIELDKANFGVLAPLEVFGPLPNCSLPNDDKAGENDSDGAFNADGGIDVVPVQLRSGCEPTANGFENLTIDIGVCFEFDCTETNQEYLALNCETTDPNNPDHNPFFPICDLFILDNFCATMTDIETFAGPSPLCANGGVPHNISWFSFVAGAGVYDIIVTPGNCQAVGGGLGIQNGIYTNCDFTEEIQCQGLPCSTAPIVLNSHDASGQPQLEPCEIYYWFLDGCSGSICEFEIDVEGNFLECDPDPPSDLFCGNPFTPTDCSAPICPGDTVNFQLQDWILTQGIQYTWTVTVDNAAFTDSWSIVDPWEFDPEIGDERITIEKDLTVLFEPNLAPGEQVTYTVCWERLDNKCYTKIGPLCREIVVRQLDDEDFGVVEICEFDLFSYTGPDVDESGNPDPNGDGTAGWQCTSIFFQEGINICEQMTPEGCSYTQTVDVVVLRNPEPTRVDTIFCEGELPTSLFGFSFGPQNEVVTDLNLRPDVLASNGCDSIIDLYVWYFTHGGILEGTCVTGPGGDPDFRLDFVADQDSITDTGSNDPETIYNYCWWNLENPVLDGFQIEQGTFDGGDLSITVPEPGDYLLEVKMSFENEATGFLYEGCTYSYQVNVDPSVFLPENPVPGNWNTMPCADGNPPVLYTVMTGPDETPTWIWPGDVTSAVGQGTDSLTIDWTGSAGGDLGVFVTNGCGNSDTITVPVTLITVPDPEISIDLDTTCIDSLFTILSVGDTIGGEVYNWTFSGGVVVGGTAVGPGPHQVSWANEGDHIVSLQVTVGDCESTTAFDTVTTVLPIAAPVIICGGSTNSSATFTWAPIPGATGYLVEIVQGPASNTGGLQTETSYTMMDMVLGDGAIISVTAITDNPCGNTTTVSLECFAQECPPEMITLTSANDTLCFDPALGVSIIDVTWADGTIPPGMGVFAGPGIADGSIAEFDPIAAGIGTHTVTYTYTGLGVDPSNNEDYTGCVYSAAMTFVIYQTPTSDFTLANDEICITDQSTVTYTGNTTNGSYDWTVTPDGGPLDGIGPFDITWPTAGAKSITLVVERNGCISDPTTRTATIDDLVGQVDVECGNSTATSVEFIWGAVANATEYALIEDGTPLPNQTTTSLSRTGLVPGTEIQLIVQAISDNLCPSTADTITCIAQNCPDFVLTIPEDTILCSDASAFDLTWSIEGGLLDGSGVGAWSGTGIVDTAAGTFDPQVSGTGSFNITLSYVEGPGGTCTGSETFTIDVIDLPVVSFTLSDDTICANEIITFNYTGTPSSLTPIINTSGGIFEQNPVQQSNYRWTFDTDGVYTVTAEAFAGSCIGTPVTDTVVVLPTPTETIDVFCDSLSLDYIRFAWFDLDCASEYEIFIDGSSVGIQSDLTYEITGLNQDDERTIRVVPINECDCATVVEGTTTCQAQACPDIQVSITPAQDEICLEDITPGATISIVATVTGAEETGVETWSGTGVSPGSLSLDGLAPGTYDIMYSYRERDGACGDNAMTTVTINSTPQGVLEKMDPACIEDNFGSVTVGSAVEGEDYNYLLNGLPMVPPTVNMLTPGQYSVDFVDPITGCSSTQNFDIISAPIVTAQVVGDQVVLLGEDALLRVELNPISLSQVSSIVWTNETTGESIPCEVALCPEITVTPDQNTTYCAQIIYNDGCVIDACAEVRVFEDKDLIFPNIFNPTGSANTSFFVPTNGEWTQVRKMRIYNRWGELVYSADNIDAADTEARGWDGRYQGQEVNPGVFVWLVEIVTLDDNGNEEIIQETGDVTVIR